jgi:3-hydroxyacyl-[acyl-carrier-protein] dehydratase
MFDIHKIWATLPHRYPLLLVDRVIEVVGEESIHAIKNVTINENFFQGHFPGNPIMPGVLIIEALAQTGGLMALSLEEGDISDKLLLFRGIDKAKFRKSVVPGDQLHLHCKLIKRRRNFWYFEGKAIVDGEIAAEAELSAIVETMKKDEDN